MIYDIAEYESIKSPIISVNVKDWGFSYEKSSPLRDNGESKCEKDEYAFLLKHICSIIEDALDSQEADLSTVISRMLDVRNKYCGRFPVLVRQICDWLCDLALIRGEMHVIPALCRSGLSDIPFGADFMVYDCFSDMLSGSVLGCGSDKLIQALRHFCTYDFTASCIYTENSEIYRKVVSFAVPEFIQHLICESSGEILLPCVKKIRRTSFSGLACSEKCVKVIEVEYFSFEKCDKARELLSQALRYCDNLVRQSLSVNSRLTGISLSAKERRIITDAVRSGMPNLLPPYAKLGRKPKNKANTVSKSTQSTTKKKENESINLDVDFTKARELLESSWELSGLFESDCDAEYADVAVFDNEKIIPACEKESVAKNEDSEVSEWEEFIRLLREDELRVLLCILQMGDVVTLARSLGGMPLGFANSINEKATDTCGDIIIEINESGSLSVFEDYREELSEIIKKTGGGDING